VDQSEKRKTEDSLKAKMKWVGKYISRPLLILILILISLYYFYPQAYEALGIDIKDIGKYSFWFFAIKGCLWILLGVYAFFALKARKKNNSN
jgi:cell division protein FtsW (lipid II flippase)